MNFWLRAETALQTLGNYYWHLCGPVVLFALQIGLQRGEAQHGPETPQLRDARDALGKLTFLEKS